MLRQNSLQTRGFARINVAKTDAELLEEAAEIEALRAAYLAVAGQSGRVVSGSSMKSALHSMMNAPPAHVMPAAAETFQIPMRSPTRAVAQSSRQASTVNPMEAAIQVISQLDREPVQTQFPQPVEHYPPFTVEHYPPFTAVNNKAADMARALEAQHSPQRQLKTEPASLQPTMLQRPKPMETARRPVTGERPVERSTFSPDLRKKKPVSSVPVASTTQATANVRPVKLPKFLMETPVETPNQGAKKPQSAFKNLPPVSQNLFADLPKDASVELSSHLKALHVSEEKAAAQQATLDFLNRGSVQAKSEQKNAASFKSVLHKEQSFDVDETRPAMDVGAVPVEGQSDWASQYHHYESVWVKLFERPRLLLGMLGLGIVSCSVYIALGYWWFGGSPMSQAAEPVAMLNMQDASKTESDSSNSSFNNIQDLQQESHSGVTKGAGEGASKAKKQGGMLLAQASPALTGATGLPEPTSGKDAPKYEPTGRVDPFAPLVSPGGDTSSTNKPEVKKDILADVQYTGFIGDINSRDKVAIIKVNDPIAGGSKTWIKKVGDAITVDGERVVIKAISKRTVALTAQGEMRHLGIQQYQANKPAPPADAGSAGGGGGGPIEPGAAGPGGGGGASGGRNPANPVLIETKG